MTVLIFKSQFTSNTNVELIFCCLSHHILNTPSFVCVCIHLFTDSVFLEEFLAVSQFYRSEFVGYGGVVSCLLSD
jgi:hypothetical protein